MRSYAAVGGVEGAIAKAAEQVYLHTLDDAERALAEPVFVRLVRLGDTGGATRRLGTRAEFDGARWRLVQKLAGPEGRRLVQISGGEGGETAEIAHEALVTQWPRYQTWLGGRDPDGRDRAADMRVLDALIRRAADWIAAPDPTAKGKRLATGADLDAFVGLARRRSAWLSASERQLVAESRKAAVAQRCRERQRTRDLRAALTEARSNLIWSQLEFGSDDELSPHEINALWQLATADPAGRAAFSRQLSGNPSLILRLAKRPEIVLRALGSANIDEHAQAMLASVMKVFNSTADPEELWSLARTVRALGIPLSDGQAMSALEHLLEASSQVDSTISLTTVCDAARLLSFALPPDSVPKAVNIVVAVAGAFKNFRMIPDVLAVLRQFPIPATRTQEQQALGGIFQSALREALDPIDVELLEETIGAAQGSSLSLDSDQAAAILQQVLKAASKTHDPEELKSLTAILGKPAILPNASQTRDVLDAILKLIKKTGKTKGLDSLVDAVQNLAPTLNADQTQASFDLLLDLLRKQTRRSHTKSKEFDSSMLNWGIAHTAADLIPRLDERQIQSSLDTLLDVLKRATDETADVTVSILVAIGSRLTGDQALTALQAILDAFRQFAETSDLSGMKEVASLGRQLSPADASSVHARVADLVEESGRPEALLALVQILPGLPVAPNREQADALLKRVVRDLESEEDLHGVWSLASAVGALAPSLEPEQAGIALNAVFDALKKPADVYARRVLALSIQALVPKLGKEQRAAALLVVSWGLSIASQAMEALAWAGTRELLLRDNNKENYIQELVTTLRYPNAALEEDNTSIGASVARKGSSNDATLRNPSEYLLNCLGKHLNAPWANEMMHVQKVFGWISANHPNIDLAMNLRQPGRLQDVLPAVGQPG
jgi:hypothetical protein